MARILIRNLDEEIVKRLKERARRQEETRQRIAAATAELHEEVGPARTTRTSRSRPGATRTA